MILAFSTSVRFRFSLLARQYSRMDDYSTEPIVISAPKHNHSATLIFFHGSCLTGPKLNKFLQNLMEKEFRFNHVKIVFPTAFQRPYTLCKGRMKTVWFDRLELNPWAPECIESINFSCNRILELIENEKNCGIPENRIVLGGFSMGGALALHVAYRFNRNLAGVFALSSFLSLDSAVYKSLENLSLKERIPPLLMCHGTRDSLILNDWGKQTFATLQSYKMQCRFEDLPTLDHSLSIKEMDILEDWIKDKLPE